MTDRSARTLLDQFLYPDLVNVVFSYVEKPIERVPINRLEVAYFRLKLDGARALRNGFKADVEISVNSFYNNDGFRGIRLRSGKDWFFRGFKKGSGKDSKTYDHVTVVTHNSFEAACRRQIREPWTASSLDEYNCLQWLADGRINWHPFYFLIPLGVLCLITITQQLLGHEFSSQHALPSA